MSNHIHLHEPIFDGDDFEALTRALKSGWVSTGGPQVDEFEREFARFVGTEFAVSTCNGTIALQLILEVIKRQRNIESTFDVIVPNLSFIATANAVVHAGGRPIFADTSSNGLCISADDVKALVESHYYQTETGSWVSRMGSKPLLAIMPVHIMGWPGEIERLRAYADDWRIPMIEDAAEALGSRTAQGKSLGTLGCAAAFSFNGNKILTTGGGGMITTDDANIARRAKHLSTTAKTDNLQYAHDEVGYNFRLVNLLAALGLSQLRKLPGHLQRKAQLFLDYENCLKDRKVEHVRVYSEPAQGNHWLVNLVFDEPSQKNSALINLNEHGIHARPLWMPFHLQPALKAFSQFTSSWPNSAYMWERTLSVPSSPHLSAEDIERIVSVMERSSSK